MWLWTVELLCAGFFTFDYLFRGIFLSNHRFDFVLSPPGLVSLVVILPVLPVSFFLTYQLSRAHCSHTDVRCPSLIC